tara:strand:- start:138 stop:812 length:675 start_codon:yes stop_codon:yes gene_type:complete
MHQKKSKKILIYFFLFLFIGTFNNKDLKKNNFSKIDVINVIGLNDENTLELMNKLKILRIENIFFLNEKQIKEILNSNDLIESYTVFKKYPSTLNIKVNETKFLAQTKKDGEDFFLGSNGKLIKMKNIKSEVPYLFGNFKNSNFFQLKEAIDETNFNYNKIKNLFFFKSGRWDIETKEGLMIKLPKDNLKRSLKFLVNFLSQNYKNEINNIDLRQYDQIIINGK